MNNLQIHLQQQQFVHDFPEQMQIKSINTAIAILINAKTPNTNLKPSFP